jgi:hypothetical protein
MPLKTSKYYYVPLFLLITAFSFAQTPILERSITFRVNNEKISTVLEIIAKQGNFSFSYNSDILEVNSRINLWVVDKPVREVLNQIFRGNIAFKVSKQYLILQKSEPVVEKKSLLLNGYVYDTQTDKPLEKVSIYDRKSLLSVVTNRFGFYSIKLSVSQLPIKLTISKPDYYQESVLIKSAQATYQNIGLEPYQQENNNAFTSIEDNSMELMDSIRNLKPISIIEPITIKPILPDITDEILFPSSPILDSTLYANYFDKFKKKLGKALVSRSQRINAQNVTDLIDRKFQASILPFIGTNRLLSGSIRNDYSVNLLMGYAGGIRKLEIGGLINGVRRNVEGLQIAGIGNIVGESVFGGQIGGIFNVAGYLEEGLQVSGIINTVIQESSGWQVAPLNFAHKVVEGGQQIGFINIANYSETTPVGFLSFVGNGYKRLELTVDENQTGSFSFKTGVRKFYNVVALHYNFTRTQEIFGIGYGIGRAYELGKAWMMNTDLTTNALIEYDDVSPNVAALWKFDISFEKQIARNVAITFGPSLKYIEISDYNAATWQVTPFNKIPSYRTISSSASTRLWIGFQMGLRIRSKQ